MRVPAYREPQRPEGGLSGVLDADAGAGHDLLPGYRLPLGDVEGRLVERGAVELAADGEGLADLARSSGEIARPGGPAPAPVLPHPLFPLDRLARPQEHGAARVRLSGDGIQAEVHAIDHVDVGVSPGEIEALVARGPAAGPGVARAVGLAEIGFRFDETEHQPLTVQLAYQIAAQEVPGDGLVRTAVEGRGARAEAAPTGPDDIIRRIIRVPVAHALLGLRGSTSIPF